MKDGRSQNTRSQTAAKIIDRDENKKVTCRPTSGRMADLAHGKTGNISPTCLINVSDGIASLQGLGLCDDGSDEIIASAGFAEAAVIKGIRRMTAIQPMNVQVALKSRTEAQYFRFIRSWTVPRIILRLSSGHLALKNISFLVPDA